MGSGYPRDWNRRRRKVYRRDNYTCRRCGKKGGRYGNAELHAHHVVPKGKGGSHKLKNLKTLCKDCHRKVHKGNSSGRPQKGFWKVMHQLADAEKNTRFGGCPKCGKRSLTVRWERLRFLKKVKVIQCSSCNAMYDEQIKRENGERYLKLVRVYSYKDITPAVSATSQELDRMAVRNEMDARAARRANRQRAQDTFGACPNCGEEYDIKIKRTLFGRRFGCDNCNARLKPKFLSRSKWEMIRGNEQLQGEVMDLLEWEQKAIEHLEDTSTSTRTQNDDGRTLSTNPSTGYQISGDTWRGRVASVMKEKEWMDARDVSEEVTKTSRKLSTGGASSVLSDMMRHNDVIRREANNGRIKYEYRLRSDVEIN